MTLRQGKVYIITGLLSAAILMTIMSAGWFRHWRESLTDFLYTQRATPAETLILEIDDSTIAAIGHWPLPRSVYATLITKLSQADAAAIGIDINFKEPSQEPEEDAAFARAIAQSRPPVVLTAEIQPNGSIIHPVGELSSLASQGFPNIFTSSDDVVRATRFEIKKFTSFALTLAKAYREQHPGELVIPEQATRIAFSGPPRTHSFISAIDVLEGRIPSSFFRDRIILIGATAKDLQDYHKTPFGLMSGVEIQASITTTLLHQVFYSNMQTLSLGLTGLFAMIVAACAMYVKRPSFFIVLLSAFVLLYTLMVFVVFDRGYVLDLLYPNLSFIFTGALVITAQYSVATREKKYIHDTFSRYLAPEVIKELIDDPNALKLGGKKEKLTILFADIRNFTTVSEVMRPEQLTKFLNAYLSLMSRIILDHKGVIDKYIGDAIMAFWGAPLPNPRQTQDSITAALKMIDALHEFNAQNENTTQPPINIGIGINTGEVTVGNMGSEKRFDYTVMGDSVNLASRLEGLSKIYGVNIIIGESTYKEIALANFVIRELDCVQVKGKKNAATIYEVVPAYYQKAVGSILSEFNRGREAYYAGKWQEAVSHFNAALSKVPTDGPSRLMKERSEEFMKNPPESWEGIFGHSEK